MAKLIYIKTSPRKDRSHSTRVAQHFVDTYREAHPKDTVEEFDIWRLDLPAFNGDAIDAKYAVMHNKSQTKEQQEAWNQVVSMFRQFASGDKYLFSVPMWNFGIPYRLKHYIDILTQPGLAFNITADGKYDGLIKGKPALVIYSSGGVYGSGSGAEGFDLQKPYMNLWLQFIGFKDIRQITVDGTLGDPAKAKLIEETCLTTAKEQALTF